MLHNAKNWDDVIHHFDQKIEVAPNQDQQSEQVYVVNLIHELFVTVDEKEIRRVASCFSFDSFSNSDSFFE